MSLELDLKECIAFVELRGMEGMGIKDVQLLRVCDVERWSGNE